MRHPSLVKGGKKYNFMKHKINKYALFVHCRVSAAVEVKITKIQLYIFCFPQVMIHLTKLNLRPGPVQLLPSETGDKIFSP